MPSFCCSNFTLEGVRRALEEDLGMERLSLDAYKKFIKQCLEKVFQAIKTFYID